MKRTTRIGVGIVLLLAFVQSLNVNAATLRVPEDHESIAAALAAAIYGDSLDLATGTYYEHDLILPPGVSIFGRGLSAEQCVIDAGQLSRVLYGEGLTRDNVIERVTFQNGLVNSSPWHGGGLYCVGHPIFLSVLIRNNEAVSGRGGGLYVNGRPVMLDCELRDNVTGSNGGGAGLDLGIIVEYPVSEMEDCYFHGNEANNGGGIFLTGCGIRFTRCVFESNQAISSGGGVGAMNPGSGVGVYSYCIFTRNLAAHGGGLYYYANTRLENCTIVDNQADWAGGFYSDSEWTLPAYPDLFNCVVAFNKGGGIGLFEWPQVDVFCCDVFGNTPANYVGYQWDHTGYDGTISKDPLFCANAPQNEYPVAANSPCLPENNDCGVLMGAFPKGCSGTATEATSWGRIKSLY